MKSADAKAYSRYGLHDGPQQDVDVAAQRFAIFARSSADGCSTGRLASLDDGTARSLDVFT
jgi:hypothetical protein